jgi:hypothetical protein
MTPFLFQPDPINRVKFKPIEIDIHKGVIKIVDEEIHYDFHFNNTESIIVGNDREEALARIREGFERQYNQYGKLKREEVSSLDYDTLLTWKKYRNTVSDN